jgi:hypothetical protein
MEFHFQFYDPILVIEVLLVSLDMHRTPRDLIDSVRQKFYLLSHFLGFHL